VRIIKIFFILILLLFISSSFVYASKDYHELGNDYLKVRVYKDNGRFSIKTVKGSSEEGGDDNKQILYDDDPPTSFTTIALDDGDDVYKYGSSDGKFISKPHVSGKSIISIWKVDDCEITQIISLSSGDSQMIKNSVKIYYEARNVDDKDIKVGIRIVLDTLLGDSDSIPYMVPGKDNISDEAQFKNRDVPTFWYSFDQLKKPKIRSIGTLEGLGLVKPDKLLFANWKRLDVDIWKYKYDKGRSFKRSLLGRRDSAVALYYNTKTIAPGKSYIAATKYGIYSVKKSSGRIWSVVFGGKTQVDIGQTFPLTLEIKNISKIDLKDCRIELELPSVLKIDMNKEGVYSPLRKKISSFDAGNKVNLRWDFISVGATPGDYSVVLKAKGEADGLLYAARMNHKISLLRAEQRLEIRTLSIDPFDIPKPTFFKNPKKIVVVTKIQKETVPKKVVELPIKKAVEPPKKKVSQQSYIKYREIIRIAKSVQTNIYLKPIKRIIIVGTVVRKLPLEAPKKILPYYNEKGSNKVGRNILKNKKLLSVEKPVVIPKKIVPYYRKKGDDDKSDSDSKGRDSDRDS